MTTKSSEALDALFRALRGTLPEVVTKVDDKTDLFLTEAFLADMVDDLEAALVEVATAEPERADRIMRSLQAQALGLIEMSRLVALQAQRQIVVAFIRGAVGVVRELLVPSVRTL